MSLLHGFGLSQSSALNSPALGFGLSQSSAPNSPAFEHSQSPEPGDSSDWSPPWSQKKRLRSQSPDPANQEKQPRSRSPSPSNPDSHPSGGSNAQPRAASPTLQPVSTFEGGTPSWTGSAVQTFVRDCKKLYAYDRVFPTAFQLDGRIASMSSQVTNWTYDFVDIFPGIHPGISKLFALLQFNSRTPTTSRRTPRWYLRGNQWLVGFNKQDFELAENQQMFGTTLDTLYQMLTGRSKQGKEDKQPFLVNLRNYLSHSPHLEVQQMQATTMAFFWRQDFFPNCSLVHLKNVSIPIHNEESCEVSMAPTMIVLDIPDWLASLNCSYPAPTSLVVQPSANDEESSSSDTDSQNSEGNIGIHPEDGIPGYNCTDCGRFISRISSCAHHDRMDTF